ncbi:putative RNA-directed DNA polymerase [Tanacetum coccineum]
MHSRFEMSLMGEMKFFLGLQIHQSPKGIFINQAKYALEILKKHNMDNCHSIGTLLATKPKLDVDLSGEPIDQSDYRSKFGSLMYLTSSRPDLVQAVCYCACYQARPTQKHLKEVKRIFKYLKGTINMGLCTFWRIQFLGDIARKLDVKDHKIALQCLQQSREFFKTYFNHKVVRLGINPMIQPEPEDLPKDNPKLEIAVLRVLIHASESNLISEGVLVRIGGSHCKVFVKKEIRDIVQFKIEELVGKPMEEDEVIVDDTMELGENMMAEMGGGHGGAGNDEKEEDVGAFFKEKTKSNLQFMDDVYINEEPHSGGGSIMGKNARYYWKDNSHGGWGESDDRGIKKIGYAQVDAIGRSGGLLLIWDSNMFTSSRVTSRDIFIAVKGSWKGIEGDRFNSEFNTRDADNFNEIIRRNSLVDIQLGGHKYTRISDDRLKFSKLDHFPVSTEFLSKWDNLSVMTLERKISDHYPIALKDMDLDFGPKLFRAFDFWLEDGEIDNVFRTAWEKPVQVSRPDCIVRDRFKNVKEALKVWSKVKFGCTKHHIKLCKKEAMKWELEAETRSLEEYDTRVWMEARKAWIEKESELNSILMQKERIKWDVEGDDNSRFFHNKVKTRCDRNNIRGLMIDGVWYEDPQKIKDETFKFYIGIFSASDKRRPRFINDRPKISIEDAISLEVPFSEIKVWNAMCGCKSDKAPGPDDFNFKYIKWFWDIIKMDILRAIRWLWDNGEFSRGCNASFVTLILKVVDPMRLGNYRPISLIGCFYKIITKILTNKIKRVIGKIVGEVKNAFIEGRYILDGVLIANETMEFVNSKKRKGIVFKVDSEKAYDSIEWRYLKEIMERMGFGTAEGLNDLLREAVEISIFRGIRVGDDEVLVSHLQYADDTIIFREWCKENISNLMNILKCFEEVSGLKINLRKSKVYGVGVESKELDRMARFMSCGVRELPFTYLGLPIGVNMRRTSTWNGVINRFESRLSEWKARAMSFGGRLTLVNPVLGSLALYYISMFCVPSSVLFIIEL